MLTFACTGAAAQMRVHLINVGQAEAVLLEFQFYAVLIDAGSEYTDDNRYAKHLDAYLTRFFTERSDLNNTIHSIIVSHRHRDHTSDLVSILKKFKVRNLIDGGEVAGPESSQIQEARELAFKSKRIVYNKITDNLIGNDGYTPSYLKAINSADSNLHIRFLTGSRKCINEHNNSLTLLINYGKASLLFLGDAQFGEDKRCSEGQLDYLLRKYAETKLLDVDVIKISHHGSRSGTSPELLKQVSPRYSLISAGNVNTRSPGPFHAWQFGHPRTSTLQMLALFTSGKRFPTSVTTMKAPEVAEEHEISEAIYCTCWDGDILLSINPQQAIYHVQTEL